MDFSAKYETPVKVGEGSFGTVYRIKNKETGEYAALKVIKEKKDINIIDAMEGLQ